MPRKIKKVAVELTEPEIVAAEPEVVKEKTPRTGSRLGKPQFKNRSGKRTVLKGVQKC